MRAMDWEALCIELVFALNNRLDGSGPRAFAIYQSATLEACAVRRPLLLAQDELLRREVEEAEACDAVGLPTDAMPPADLNVVLAIERQIQALEPMLLQIWLGAHRAMTAIALENPEVAP